MDGGHREQGVSVRDQPALKLRHFVQDDEMGVDGPSEKNLTINERTDINK